jgi:hypothetical protein
MPILVYFLNVLVGSRLTLRTRLRQFIAPQLQAMLHASSAPSSVE